MVPIAWGLAIVVGAVLRPFDVVGCVGADEYFALPDRFLFFELRDFQSALAACEGEELEVIIGLDEAPPRLEQQVSASCFRLFCAPAINLFRRQFSRGTRNASSLNC